MKVIKFPRADERKRVKQTSADGPKLFIGAFSITCPCGSVSQVEPTNMIFRSIEFYCDKCGAAHKITNPAFSPPRTK